LIAAVTAARTPVPTERVTLARLLRPWGNRGELVAALLTDFPDHLQEVRRVWLWDGQGEPQPAEMISCRLDLQRQRAIVGFAGCTSIAEARRLVGMDIQIPLEQRRRLPAGVYYVTDLIGCTLYEQSSGEVLGTVRDVFPTGGAPLLVVDTPQGELLVPFAEEICPEVDPPARRIAVRLPEGLREQR
jgi:16S rRNA processing protein RimM